MRENLSEKEYIDLVVSPIADEVQKVETARELEAHIDERTAYYKALGLSEEAARQKAVADMGDPEPVGAKLARLHPKGGIFKKIFYTLLLAFLLVLFLGFFFVNVDDGSSAFGILETILLSYFLALSRAGRRQKSLYLSLLSTIDFALTGFYYLFIKFDASTMYSASKCAAVFSPMVVKFFSLLTGDFDCLRLVGGVGGVTVAPWLSVASFLFYGLIFATLLGSSIYVRKLQKQRYSLFDKKAGKGIAALQKGVPIGLAVVLVLSFALMPLGSAPKMPAQGEPKYFDTVIVAQSDAPCSWASVAPEDILVLESDYDFGSYIFGWYEDSFDGYGISYLQHAHRVHMDDNKKIHYKVRLETLACAPEKPYVCVLFTDDEIYECEDLSSLPPIEAEDWQEVKDGAVYSAVIDNYNCFEVTIYKS